LRYGEIMAGGLRSANLQCRFLLDLLSFSPGELRLFLRLAAKAIHIRFSRPGSISSSTIGPAFEREISPDAPRGVQLEVNAMKRLISAALALTLIGSTAAVADPYGHRGGWGGGRGNYDRGYRHGDNGAGLAIGLGVGLFALAAIAASQHNDRYDDRYRGYDNGYDNGYGQNYGGYRGGYNDYRGGYYGR
jgi:hypothetical protein